MNYTTLTVKRSMPVPANSVCRYRRFLIETLDERWHFLAVAVVRIMRFVVIM